MNTIDVSSLTKIQSVSGGDINAVFKVRDQHHRLFFLKEQKNNLPHFFQSEVSGLNALRDSQQVLVPETIFSTGHQLLLEWIEPGKFTRQTWLLAGNHLANLHQNKQVYFGFTADNYCGLTPQINANKNDGYEFFIEYRLLHLMQIARDMGLADKADWQRLEAICRKLPTLVPEQEPALIHGDLWSGNLMANMSNEPVFIDPACYFGWPEADLAMTTLFGRFPDEFYDAYFAVRPQAKNFEQRQDIYNLYHLLNHLILFGSGYQAQVKQIIKHWA